MARTPTVGAPPRRAGETVMRRFFEFFAGGGMLNPGLGARWHCLVASDLDERECATYAEVRSRPLPEREAARSQGAAEGVLFVRGPTGGPSPLRRACCRAGGAVPRAAHSRAGAGCLGMCHGHGCLEGGE